MRYKKTALYFSLFLVLFNCKEDLNIIFIEDTITTTTNTLVDINIPKAIGNTTNVSLINKELHKLVITALQIGNSDNILSNSIEESITSFNEEFQAFNAEFPEISQPWEAQIDGEVVFKSSEIICISITSYINTGGAHGINTISFLNFDPKTGKRITNNHLFKNQKGFEAVAKAYFKKSVSDEDMLFEPDTFKLPANIGFTNQGVILLYNQYEIAPYSTGIIDCTIPYNAIKGYLAFNSPY